jgi:tripartite ATP-independent transporter DctP family solute receptor
MTLLKSNKIKEVKMKQLTVCGLLVFGILGMLLSTAHGADTEKIVLKLGHITAPGGSIDKEAQKFKELVSAKSEGRVRIDVYPAAQLGKIRELLEGVSMGTVDLALEAHTFLAQLDKDFNFFNAPFLWRSNSEVLDNYYYKGLLEKLRKVNGIRTLSSNGFRSDMHLFTKTRPVKSLKDLEGLKLRTPSSRAWLDTWNGLGAIATPIPWSEVYMALSQNVIDGMPHNATQVRDEKFYEHLKYCTLLNWKPSLNCIWMSEKKYKRFSNEIRCILKDSAMEAGAYFTKSEQEEEKKAWAMLKKAGMEVFEVDKEPWLEKAKAIVKKMDEDGSWSKGLLDEVDRGCRK